MFCKKKKSIQLSFSLYLENKILETKRDQVTLPDLDHETWMEIRGRTYMSYSASSRKEYSAQTFGNSGIPLKSEGKCLPPFREPSNPLFYANHSLFFAKYFLKTKASQHSSSWCEAKQNTPSSCVVTGQKFAKNKHK